ncbi:MAG: TVP38/TMEM64 family protein [Acidimicrobiaceae bacterium]|nr:TVP38/TMEM64 family protein [Acidimicrobiaceae bacterium]
MSIEPTSHPGSPLAITRLVVLVVALVGVGVGLAIGGTDGARDLLTEVGESNWGFVAFVAAYALTVVLLLPGTLGTVTAGAVFGFPVGAAAALAGATIGSTCAFIISRAMGRNGAQSLFGSRLSNIDDFIGRNDFTSILVLRLMPIVPFNLLNYGSGLTSVRLSRYVLASVIGMAPATLLATGLGAQADNPRGITFLVLLSTLLVVLVGSSLWARRIRDRAVS